MSDETDLDLYQATGASEEPPLSEPPAPPSPWLGLIGLVVLIAGGATFWHFRPRHVEPPAPAAVSSPAPRDAMRPAAAAPAATTLPPLDETDPAVREIVGGLSRHATLLAWLSGDNLLRNVATVASMVAGGQSPAGQLRRLTPTQPFRVLQAGGRTVVDPAGYARYDAVAAAVESIDPQAASRAYATLAPRLEDAWRELGIAGTTFKDVSARAVAQVLQAPVIEGDIPLESKGIVYAFADPRLEGLAPVQKLLVRMGPENTRRIQARVREWARAIGIEGDARRADPTR